MRPSAVPREVARLMTESWARKTGGLTPLSCSSRQAEKVRRSWRRATAMKRLQTCPPGCSSPRLSPSNRECRETARTEKKMLRKRTLQAGWSLT